MTKMKSGRVVVFGILALFVIAIIGVGAFQVLNNPSTNTATSELPPSATPTITPTPDPFESVPTVTPYGRRGGAAVIGQPVSGLNLSSVGAMSSTADPIEAAPAVTAGSASLRPDTWAAAEVQPADFTADIPPPPTGDPPTRLTIPKLNLDVSVEAVGLVPSDGAPDVFEWGVPAYRAAGWLDTSAALG